MYHRNSLESVENFLTPNASNACLMAWVLGYFVYDLMTVLFVYEEKSNLDHEIIYHHTMAITGGTIAISAGYGIVAISTVVLLGEASSVFLNYKDMIEFNSPLWKLNFVCFFFSYTVFRFMLQPYMLSLTFRELAAVWHLRTNVELACAVVYNLEAILMWALNAYWYKKILIRLRKTFVDAPKKVDGDEKKTN